METQNKSTKHRLDELKELYSNGYVTEIEFKAARLNILRDGGVDVAARPQKQAHRRSLQENEEESKGSGCGCFMATLLLALFFVLGLSFFAAPYWPDRLGGAGARAAREWFAGLIGYFGEPAGPVPDPVSFDDGHREEDSPGATEPVPMYDVPETTQPDAVSEPVTVLPPPVESVTESVTPMSAAPPDVTLPSLNTHRLEHPPDVAEPVPDAAEPEIIVIEIQTSASADANVNSENAVRGYITGSSVRIRSAPDTSTNANVLGWARRGERFTVMEETVGRDGSRWYYVVYDDGDKRGWTSGSLLRLERQGE